MQWLEAAAAFAVVMMVFSTLATIVLETAHRITRIRERGLERLVATMYDRVVKPRVAGALERSDRDTFVTALTSTQVRQIADDAPGYKKRLHAIVGGLVNGGRLDRLTTLGFIERLAQTDEGQALLEQGREQDKAYMTSVIADMVAHYEAFGDNVSQYFQRRARLASCAIGLVLAFSLNLDPVNLFTTLLTDPTVRVQLVQDGDRAAAALDQSLADLRLALQLDDDDDNVEQLRAQVANVLTARGTMEAYAIPIGWQTAPWWHRAWGTCAAKTVFGICAADILPAVRWVLFVALGGLLVGLGGPFWFDTFRKLAALMAVVRYPQSPAQQSKEAEDRQAGAAPLSAAAPDDFERRVTEIFTRTAQAYASLGAAGRPVSASHGSAA
jgi:hypothetical protein